MDHAIVGCSREVLPFDELSEVDHRPGCDGTCIVHLNDEEFALFEEENKWFALDLNPGAIGMNTLDLGMKINCMVDALVEAGLIDKEKMYVEFLKRKTEFMENMRAEMEPQVRQAKLTAGIGGKMLIGPDGKPLKLQ